jgi:hypothetical protein
MRGSSVLEDHVAHRVCRPRKPRTTASTCPLYPQRTAGGAEWGGGGRCLDVGKELPEERVVDADVGDADLIAVAHAAPLLLELVDQVLDLERRIQAQDLHDCETVLPQALQMFIGSFGVP